MDNLNQFPVQCEVCGKRFRNTQGLRGHEMFKCKVKQPASREEVRDTIEVSHVVSAYYNYAKGKGFDGTLQEFVDQTVDVAFQKWANEKGIRLLLSERIG